MPSLGVTPARRSHAVCGAWLVRKCWGLVNRSRCLSVASPRLSSPCRLACRFRFGERHGQSSRRGGEAEPPLEKLQVDHRPGAQEGIAQAVSLRWADFQHARECCRVSPQPGGYNSNRVADLHDRLRCGCKCRGHGHVPGWSTSARPLFVFCMRSKSSSVVGTRQSSFCNKFSPLGY